MPTKDFAGPFRWSFRRLAGSCAASIFLGNVLSLVRKTHQSLVAVVVRSILLPPDIETPRAQLRRTIGVLESGYPKVARPLEEVGEDVLAHLHFPAEHRRQLHSTNTSKRLTKEITRRTNVVGVSPSEQAVLRLVGSILAEQHDEWAVGRRYSSQESMAMLTQPSTTDTNVARGGRGRLTRQAAPPQGLGLNHTRRGSLSSPGDTPTTPTLAGSSALAPLPGALPQLAVGALCELGDGQAVCIHPADFQRVP